MRKQELIDLISNSPFASMFTKEFLIDTPKQQLEELFLEIRQIELKFFNYIFRGIKSPRNFFAALENGQKKIFIFDEHQNRYHSIIGN